MTKDDVLTSVGRPGWKITGERDEIKAAVDSKGTPLGDQPTGNKIWTISSADGSQTDTITVKPAQYTGAFETAPNGDLVRGTEYTVLQGPSHEVPAAPKPSNEPTVGTEKDEIEGGRRVTKRYTGNGVWTIVKDNGPVGAGDTKVPAGTTRTTIQSGRLVTETVDGNGVWNVTNVGTDVNPPAPKDPPRPTFQVIDSAEGKQLVQINPDGTTKVLQTFPPGMDIRNTPAGGVIAINPADPTHPQVIVPDPPKPSTLVPGQSAAAGQFILQKPDGTFEVVPNPTGGQPTEVSGQQGPTILVRNPDGTYSTKPNPAYQSKFQQGIADLHAGIDQIEGMWARGEITPQEAEQYKKALQQNFDAALQGTTPYQQYQDRQQRAQTRMQSGAGLLNQRVSSGSGLAESLLSSAVGIVGNKNFMDPSAVAGFTPFQGAYDYVTDLGGGQGVYDAAAQAVQTGLKGDDPAAALLQAALNPQATAPAQQQTTQNPSALDPTLLPPGVAGTVAPNDPRYMGSQPGPGMMPGATDPGLALLNAALGGRYRQPQQMNPALRGGPMSG